MLENYEYKDIPGYEGLYAVTTDGQVWSYRRQRFLSPGWQGSGYLFVILSKDGTQKHHKVHRLVLSTFNPVEDMDKLDVNHLNEIKTDNYLDNLCWMTRQQNCNYGTHNERVSIKLGKPVRCIETGIVYASQSMAARAVGLSSSTGINLCCNGKAKTAGKLHWEYVDKNY